MSEELLKVIRDFKGKIKDSQSNTQIMNEICGTIVPAIGTGIYIIDCQSKLLLQENAKNSKQVFRLKAGTDGKYIETQLNEQFTSIVETKANASLAGFHLKNFSKAELNEFKTIIIPMYAHSERIGTMVIVGFQTEFNTDSIVTAEFCSILASMALMHEQKEENAEESRRLNVVRSALSTLSFSELEAILRIFDELPGNEGLLVASKIADKVGITRSVIVNALRKFESAGVIESRSLGMKGTYIKVLNETLIEELNKMRR